MDSIDSYLQFLEPVLAETARIALGHFNRAIDIQQKSDASPVTIADQEVEAYLRNRLLAAYPDHGILGEEQAAHDPDAESLWVIDPIDGTRSFISGVPLWGTLVALLHNSRPVIGIIDVPALHERWIGVADGPTLRNETLCRTSGCRELREANLSATSPDMFSAGEFAIFDSLSKQARFRRFGGDCYLYAMLASGRIDAVIEAGLKPYDYLAAVPVITSAGGVITDWKGNPLTTASDGRVIAAATPALHEQLLAETSALAT